MVILSKLLILQILLGLVLRVPVITHQSYFSARKLPLEGNTNQHTLYQSFSSITCFFNFKEEQELITTSWTFPGVFHVFKPITTSWSGYMSSIAKTENKGKSIASTLPIINFHATDPTALYSLLLFLEKQSQKLGNDTPVLIFDQQLYIKDCEIVASKKMKVFLRLGGFH